MRQQFFCALTWDVFSSQKYQTKQNCRITSRLFWQIRKVTCHHKSDIPKFKAYLFSRFLTVDCCEPCKRRLCNNNSSLQQQKCLLDYATNLSSAAGKKAPFLFIIQSMIKRKFSQFSRQTWKEVRLFIIGTVLSSFFRQSNIGLQSNP